MVSGLLGIPRDRKAIKMSSGRLEAVDEPCPRKAGTTLWFKYYLSFTRGRRFAVPARANPGLEDETPLAFEEGENRWIDQPDDHRGNPRNLILYPRLEESFSLELLEEAS